MTTPLREQLLEQSTPDPNKRADYDRAIQDLLAPRQSPKHRIMAQIAGTAALLLAMPMGLLFLQESGPLWIRLGLLLCTLAPLNMGIMLWSKAKSKRPRLRVYGPWHVAHLTVFGWGFAGLVLMKALASPEPETLLPLVAFAVLMALGLGILPLVLWRVKQSELVLREHLLRIEIRLNG